MALEIKYCPLMEKVTFWPYPDSNRQKASRIFPLDYLIIAKNMLRGQQSFMILHFVFIKIIFTHEHNLHGFWSLVK